MIMLVLLMMRMMIQMVFELNLPGHCLTIILHDAIDAIDDKVMIQMVIKLGLLPGRLFGNNLIR